MRAGLSKHEIRILQAANVEGGISSARLALTARLHAELLYPTADELRATRLLKIYFDGHASYRKIFETSEAGQDILRAIEQSDTGWVTALWKIAFPSRRQEKPALPPRTLLERVKAIMGAKL